MEKPIVNTVEKYWEVRQETKEDIRKWLEITCKTCGIGRVVLLSSSSAECYRPKMIDNEKCIHWYRSDRFSNASYTTEELAELLMYPEKVNDFELYRK